MRVLLIAYEYPPSPSPQSLRWMYLTRELVRRGHQVHVLCPDLPANGRAPAPVPGVTVHRSFPGPWAGLIAALSRRRQRHSGGTADAAPAKTPDGPVTLNWKGRLQTRVSRLLGLLLFPDARAEWRPFARRRLVALLAAIRPDVVVSSHEPATSLQLGLLARRLGHRWVADLGDPVLADYTPWHWRRRALALERRVCRQADGLCMTTPAALALLAGRHGRLPPVAAVITQGYDEQAAGTVPATTDVFDRDRLELLYTGSFYDFRAPDALLAAVRSTPGVRLNIVSREAPAALVAAARDAPDRLRLFGHLPHERTLALQRSADVLVNLGNPSPVQIPGKVYEYLGAERPILHVRSPLAAASGADPVVPLLDALRAGLAVEGSVEGIAAALSRFLEARARGGLPEGIALDDPARRRHAWQQLGGELEAMLVAVVQNPGRDG